MNNLLMIVLNIFVSQENLTFAMQIIQTLVVVIGIPLVLRQIRQQTDAMKLDSNNFQFTTYIEMMNKSGQLTEMLLTDKDLSSFYDETSLPGKFPESYEELSQAQKKQYLYLGRIVSTMEQAYLLWSRKWMDDIDFRAALTQYQEIIGLKKFTAWWNLLKPYYRSDFVHYIDYCRTLNEQEFFVMAMKARQVHG